MFTLAIHLDQQTTRNRFNAKIESKTTKLVVVVFMISQLFV